MSVRVPQPGFRAGNRACAPRACHQCREIWVLSTMRAASSPLEDRRGHHRRELDQARGALVSVAKRHGFGTIVMQAMTERWIRYPSSAGPCAIGLVTATLFAASD